MNYLAGLISCHDDADDFRDMPRYLPLRLARSAQMERLKLKMPRHFLDDVCSHDGFMTPVSRAHIIVKRRH